MNDAILRDAIQQQRCLSGLYEGLLRHFAPHALGAGVDDTLHVFVFQYAGESAGGLPRGGQWRCFRVDGLSDVRANGERWRTRSNYSLSRQSCLARIDLAVPTSS
jgi:hypothetical protein